MKWNVNRAKAWMLQQGFNHIEGGLPVEGAELIYQSKWGEGCLSQEQFVKTIKDNLCWDIDSIAETLTELKAENYHVRKK